MAAPEWRWLLQRTEDRELICVARVLRLRLTGYRGLRWERDFAAVRPRVIQALLQAKMLPRLRQALNARVRRDSRLLEIRQLTEGELRERLREEQQPEHLLLALLSSHDRKARQRAARLFESMRSNGSLTGWLTAEQPPTAEAERERTELEALRQQQAAWQDDRRQLLGRVTGLESELELCRAGAERNWRLWEAERQSLLSRLADRETRLQQREQKLALIEQGRGNAQLPQPAPPAPEETKWMLPGSVVLVGNINLDQANISQRHQLSHIALGELQQPQASEALDQAREIWLLTYATPLPLQRLIRRQAGERLRCFASYEDLLTFVEQGGENDAQRTT